MKPTGGNSLHRPVFLLHSQGFSKTNQPTLSIVKDTWQSENSN